MGAHRPTPGVAARQPRGRICLETGRICRMHALATRTGAGIAVIVATSAFGWIPGPPAPTSLPQPAPVFNGETTAVGQPLHPANYGPGIVEGMEAVLARDGAPP